MNKTLQINRIKKILSIIAISFVLLELLIILVSNQANGYEISIYTAYPPYFWLLIIISLSFPFISMFLYSFISKTTDNEVNLFPQLVTASITLLILLLLPFFRGYLFYQSGDTFSHLGYIKDILAGTISGGDIYPLFHIWLSILDKFTGYNVNMVSLLILPFFVQLFILFLYILVKTLNFSKIEIYYIVIFALIPILGMEMTREYIFLSFEAFCFLPLIFFIFFKNSKGKKQISNYVVLIILLIIMPFFHLETTLFLIILFTGMYIVYITINNNKFRHYIANSNQTRFNSLFPILLLIIAFFLWITHLDFFRNFTLAYSHALFTGLGETTVKITTDALSFTSLNYNEIIWLIVKTWGVIVAFFIVASVISLIVILKISFYIKDKVTIVLFSSLFLLLDLILGLLFFKDWVQGISLRFAKYGVFIGIIIVGYYCARVFFTKKTIIKICILCLFLLFVSFAVMNTFPSPWVNYVNRQIPQSSYSGSTFFIANYDQQYPVYELQTRLWNYYEIIYGIEKFRQQQIFVEGTMLEPPDHFEYLVNGILGDTITRDSYLIFNKMAKIYYPSIYPQYPNIWKFSPSDFSRLEYDSSIDHIYSNSDIECYFINKK